MTEKTEGRILRSLSGFYDVQTPGGLITCRARGILRKAGNSPLTGDLVEISVEKGKGMVERILPRKNHFIRPAVANVDALGSFITISRSESSNAEIVESTVLYSFK